MFGLDDSCHELTHLNKPSGSNGPRHQSGAPLRGGPEAGELSVQA